MKTLVNVKDLSVSYFTYAGEVQSVGGVSFDIESGKTTALVGESGCGKSVTSKALMGLIERPGVVKEGSQIFYEGKNILDFKEKEWLDFRGKECSMIFQDALVSLNPTMMIGKQIMENLENHNDEKLSKTEIRKRAQQMLELVGIPDAPACLDKYPHELSGGMRQRVMIATALITNPKLLIADEPTTALDVTIQAQILDLMNELKQETGSSCIFITHDLGVVANVADRVAVMYAGQIVEYGTVEEIFYDAWHPYTWALLQALPQLGTKGEALPSVDGTPPNLFNEIKGDAFAPRNKHALAIDFVQEPPFFQVSETHAAKTWYLDPRAPKIERPHSIQNLREKMGKMGGANLNG